MKLISSAEVESQMRGVGGNESGRGGFGAGGDDRLVEADDPRALRRFDAQGVGRGELALPGYGLDLALLREAGEAARQLLDHAVLPTADRGRVEGRRAKAHAVRTHRLGVVDDLGDMQQRLGRDAADVETDAAERRARVDQNDVLSEIGGAEGGGIAAGTGAQNKDIGLEIGLSARVGGGFGGGPAGAAALGAGSWISTPPPRASAVGAALGVCGAAACFASPPPE